MRQLKVYIAGKMNGLKAYNFQRFFEVQGYLESRGYDVVNPAEFDVIETYVNKRSRSWEDCLADDLQLLSGCDAIMMLGGWEDSEGANIELEEAQSLGLIVAEGPDEAWLEDHGSFDQRAERFVANLGYAVLMRQVRQDREIGGIGQ